MVLLSPFLSLALALGAGPSPVCERVPVGLAKVWLPDAAWSVDGKTLVVTDVAEGRLLRFSARGERLADISSPGSGPRDFNHPTVLHPTAEGFLLTDGVRRWLALDHEGRPVRQVVAADRSVIGVMAQAVLLDGELVGFGSAAEGEGRHRSGFLRLSLEPLKVIARAEGPAETSPEIDFYSALPHLVVAAGPHAYALRFTEPPRIERLFPPGRLQAFPPGFEQLARIPPGLTGPGRQADFDSFFVKQTLPVALFGQGGDLYLLTRQPASEGGTRWRLHRIDPNHDRLLGSVDLPTRVINLLVAPGPAWWAVLEEGMASAEGRLSLESLLLLSTEWLARSGSPSFGDTSDIRCLNVGSERPSPAGKPGGTHQPKGGSR